MAPQTHQQGEGGTESSRTMGISSNTPPAETQLQCRHHFVHCDAANAATRNMTLDAQLKSVHKNGSSKNKEHQAIGCKCRHIEVHSCQLMIYHTAGVRREVRDQFIAAHNWKPPWSSNAFVRIFHKIKHHDVVSSGMFAVELSDKNPWQWTEQALTTLADATEAYMVEVIAESNMLMQELIPM